MSSPIPHSPSGSSPHASSPQSPPTPTSPTSPDAKDDRRNSVEREDEERVCIQFLLKEPADRTESDIDALCAWVTTLKSPWFQNNSESMMREICRCLRYEHIPADTVLFHQGDEADKLYIILHGSVSLWVLNDKADAEYPELSKQQPAITRLKQLHDDVVHSRVITPSITRMQIEKKHQPIQIRKRPSTHIITAPGERLLDESAARIKTNPSSPKIGGSKRPVGLNRQQKPLEMQFLGLLRARGPTTSFGELALISDQTRSATIRTDLEDSEFLTIGKADFDRVLKARAHEELSAKVADMKKFAMFSKMGFTHLSKISLHMKLKKFTDNQLIVKEGPAHHIYFVRAGQIALTKQKLGEAKRHSLKVSQQPQFERIHTFDAGAVAGLAEAVNEPPLPLGGSLRSMGDSEVYEIHRDDVLRRVRPEVLAGHLPAEAEPDDADPDDDPAIQAAAAAVAARRPSRSSISRSPLVGPDGTALLDPRGFALGLLPPSASSSSVTLPESERKA